MIIKIYSTPTCPYCQMAKNFFTQKGFKYEEFDVSTDETARDEMIAKTGQLGVPVIEIDDNIIIGFDQKVIEEILEESKK
jgi:glutaredoxin-like YruB-family protein